MTLQRLAICLSMAALLTILFRYFIVHDKDVDELLARYVAGGQIATEIKDTAIEQAATSKRTKLLVGYAFYNYVYQLMHERYPNLVKHVRTDEKYDPADMNLIFITRDNDPDNLLGIFNVETVKYIGRNIILINKEFIDELARIQIVSLTDYQNNYFILKDGHYSEHGEDTFNRLSRKQLSEVYGLMFASYVIIHEIVKSLSADSGDNDADIRADYGIVTLLTKMNEDKTLVQGEKDYGLQIFDLTNDALAAYGYYLRRASIKNGQGKGKINPDQLPKFVIYSSGYFWTTICNFFTALDKKSLEGKFEIKEGHNYVKACKETEIRKTIWW